MERLERVADEGGQLLRVETQAAGSTDDGVTALLLTFDVGRVLLRADPTSNRLDEQYLESAPSPTSDWIVADEQEPWWRVLGSPLSRVREIEAGKGPLGVTLQFRRDDDHPRQIALLVRGGGLSVELQPSGS